MWEASFIETDCDVHKVMDGLLIDRNGEAVNKFSPGGRKKLNDAAKMTSVRRVPVSSEEDTHLPILKCNNQQ